MEAKVDLGSTVATQRNAVLAYLRVKAQLVVTSGEEEEDLALKDLMAYGAFKRGGLPDAKFEN